MEPPANTAIPLERENGQRILGGESVSDFTGEELAEALRAIDSTLRKCEKVLPKLREGTSQHTLLVRRIKALRISSALIGEEMERTCGRAGSAGK